MSDLISKTAVIEILSTMQGRCDSKAALVQNSKIWQQVKDMPTVDAIPMWFIKGCQDDHLIFITELVNAWEKRKNEYMQKRNTL